MTAPLIRTPTSKATDRQDRTGKSVTFGGISMREYELALGDNIACKEGPPLSMGKKYMDQEQINLETYEDTRGARRTRNQLWVEPSRRREILIFVCGYSEHVVLEKEIELARERRLRQCGISTPDIDVFSRKREVNEIIAKPTILNNKRRCVIRRHRSPAMRAIISGSS